METESLEPKIGETSISETTPPEKIMPVSPEGKAEYNALEEQEVDLRRRLAEQLKIYGDSSKVPDTIKQERETEFAGLKQRIEEFNKNWEGK